MPSTTYVYSGAVAHEFPSHDGVNPSVTLEPGDTVEIKGDNPWPGLLEPVTPSKSKTSEPAKTEE